MNLRKFFTNTDARLYGKAHRRLSKVPPSTICDWAFQSNVAMQQAIEVVARDGDRAALQEMRQGAVTLLAAADILDKHLP